MKKAILLLFSALFFLPAFHVDAQKALLKRADKRFNQFAYFRSAQLYRKFLDKKPQDQHATERLADSYRLTSKYEQAEEFYRKAMEGDISDPIYRFYYGDALMNNEKYPEAATQFQEYLKAVPGDQKAIEKLSSCNHYRKFKSNVAKYRVLKLDINTAEADFAPSIYNGQMIFASARQNEEFLFGWTGRAFLDLYGCDYKGTTRLSKPTKLRGLVNSKYHEGGISFSPDEKAMYFTRNNYFQGKAGTDNQGTILLKTYVTQLVNGRWKEVKGMPFNSDTHSSGHPAIFASGNRMVLVSDMPGGQGGTDLYLVIRRGNDWGTPQNLGPEINTKANEMFPFVDEKDGALYFSSNGLQGLGGLDLFKAEASGEAWKSPENLSFPMNTAQDDFGFVYDHDANMGFFSSNRRDGEGDDDIYGFEMKRELRIKVLDFETGLPIDSADLAVREGITTLKNFMADGNGIIRFYPPDQESFTLVASHPAYLEKQENISILDFNDDNSYTVPILLRALPKPDCPDMSGPIVLDAKVSDKSPRQPEPGTKVKIYTKEREFDLSENPNIFDQLARNEDYIIQVDEKDFPTKKFEITTAGLKPNDTLEYEISLSPIPDDVGKVFYIIYYNFDKHDIRKDASDELDRVVRFMEKYPKVTVELSSHTDSRGSATYNEMLSHNRAIEAFDYIIKNGIVKERLKYSWRGEGSLANKCENGVECTEEEHQLNRRTEFKLIGYK